MEKVNNNRLHLFMLCKALRNKKKNKASVVQGGGEVKKIYDGAGDYAGRNLKTPPPPIHIKAKPENHTYLYNLT